MSGTGRADPYLSVVVTTRNDNHGGDLLHRTQVFLNGLAAQCERHGIDTELVVVEWNPPADRPRLADALRWPEPGRHFEARIVEVGPELHRRLAHADRLPLFQMIAKNVGIRRARGRFVLATNIDLLFSDALMRFLAARRLDPGLVYRVDRYDVDVGIPDAPIAEQLDWCERNLLRICRREGIYEIVTGRFYRIYENVGVPLWLAPWLRVARFVGRQLPLRILHAIVLMRGAAIKLARGFPFLAIAAPVRAVARFAAKVPGALYRRLRGRARPQVERRRRRRRRRRRWQFRIPSLSVAARLAEARSATSLHWRFLRRAWLAERARMRLHTNACGDFTLLSREGWLKTAAYPELEMFSMHIDSLFMYEAYYAGYREHVLPHAVYHMEHDAGFKPDESSLETLNARLDRDAIPQISNEQFLEWVIEMYQRRRTVFPRSDAWGLADDVLREQTVVSAGSEAAAASLAGVNEG